MKKKYSRILGVALTLVLLASLFGFATPVSAANVGWSGIVNPGATLATGLNLADVEVGPIAVTPDGGTVFAAVNVEAPAGIAGISIPGRTWALLQSADGGHNWTATGLIMNIGPITGIAISSNFATDGTMYVAAWSGTLPAPAVFRSNNRGTTFTELKGVPPDLNGWPTTVITSIDMWPASPYPYVMVGTDTDVWVLQDAPFGVWMDQEVNPAVAVPIVDVAFAPDFATTYYIWAVTRGGLVTCTNSPGAWGTVLTNTLPLVGVAVVSACIDFPDDYNSATKPYLWVGLDTGANNLGGVWRIRGLPLPHASQAIKQWGIAPIPGANWDIRSIAVSGAMATATILAGEQDNPLIRGSLNGGVTWTLPVFKQPTGAGITYVVMAPDFATSSVAYVGTSDGSGAGTGEPAATAAAFQVSRNGGMSWNQTGLIDSNQVAIVINDVAVVSLDTIFMVTDTFSLWKTEDATATKPVWERILTARTGVFPANALTAAPTTLDFVETSPDFLTDGVVYVANLGTGVMKSTDGGNIFAPMGPPGAAITALHVLDATFAFTGAVNNVYRTDDGAYSWIGATVPPVGTVMSIATSPDYATTGTLLVGTNISTVYRSATRGITFAIAGAAITAAGNTYVAFDPGYATNNVVYAAANAVISRFNFALPTVPWTPIDATIPTGVAVPGAAGDAFSIIDPAAAADNGNIVVTSGSVTVYGSSATTTPAAGAPVVVAAGGTTAWAVTAAVGEFITVEATTANAAGVWSQVVGGARAGIVIDADGDASVTLTAGAFLLPDAAGVGPPTPSTINGLMTSPDGTLYGSNALLGQGMERSLNPTATTTMPVEGWIAPVFERATSALALGATFNGLWLRVDDTLAVTGSKNVIFSIDTTGIGGIDRIMTYTDTLATPVVSVAPEEGAVFPREAEVTLEWERLTGALSYHWQIARDARFLLIADQGFSGYPADTSVLLGAGRTYYWRVRVDGTPAGAPGLPVLSRWSETRTFTTLIDSEPPQNAKDYPRYEVGEQNPDGTYQVTIADKVLDTGSGVKKVVAKVNGNVEFEADDINLPEYEFSFVVNLDPVDHTLTIEAWDVVGNYLQKAVSVVVPRVVQATINFDPDTLNLKSKGKVVTVYIELPEGYDVEEIDISSVMLNGIVPALAHPTEVGDYDSDGVPDLMVKFDRSDVQDVLDPGDEVEVTVSGQLTDGTPFEGTDTIRVIEKGRK